MTSADVERGLITEKNLYRNENADTSSHYDPEIRKLLEEISIDTKATRKSSEVRIYDFFFFINKLHHSSFNKICN